MKSMEARDCHFKKNNNNAKKKFPHCFNTLSFQAYITEKN